MPQKEFPQHTADLVHVTPAANSRYTLDLLTLPEYQDRDIDLSVRLAEWFFGQIEVANGVSLAHLGPCRLRVTDSYTTETNPHYQLKITFGHSDDSALSKTVEASIGYSATAEGEHFDGSIRVALDSLDGSPYVRRPLTQEAFQQYDKLASEIYPEWHTTYDSAGIQFTPISPI